METITTTASVMQIDNPSGLESCDTGGCPANALWRVVFLKGELTFCGNHAVTHGYISRLNSHAAYENEVKTQGSDHLGGVRNG